MKTLRQIKLKEYMNNEITLQELKEILYTYYYPNYKRFTHDIQHEINHRDLIITKIKNGYGNVYTIIFSLNGSPPKGEAILQVDNTAKEYYQGNLILLGNGKTSKVIYRVKILGENK